MKSKSYKCNCTDTDKIGEIIWKEQKDAIGIPFPTEGSTRLGTTKTTMERPRSSWDS